MLMSRAVGPEQAPRQRIGGARGLGLEVDDLAGRCGEGVVALFADRVDVTGDGLAEVDGGRLHDRHGEHGERVGPGRVPDA